MANPPPPYDNITGISRAVMKDNAQETLGNYNGNARPGELVVDLTQDPPPLYVGNNAGQLTLVASGGGAGLPLANGTSNFNIATVNGNATITTASANTWTFSTTGNLTLPGNNSQINYANGNSVLAAYATISSVYTSNVTTQSINNADSGGTYNNSSTLDITYTAYNGASTLDFDIAYQAPLTANIGISVGAVSTPLIQSNANIQIQANTGTAQTWTFVTTGNLELPSEGNIVGVTPNNIGHLQWVGNSSGDGGGYTTMRLVPDNTVEAGDQYLIIDPTGGGHIHIRAGGTQDASNAILFIGGENSYVSIGSSSNPPVTIAANNYSWSFGVDSQFSAAGNIYTLGEVRSGSTVTPPLPLANLTATAGSRAFASDANLVATGNFGQQVTGGASNTVPVWSDGTNWYIG